MGVQQMLLSGVPPLEASIDGGGGIFYAVDGNYNSSPIELSANVIGGVPPYTYLWSFPSGPGELSIDTPTASSSYFSGTGLVYPNVYVGTVQCVVTDAALTVVTPTAPDTGWQP